MKQPFINVTRVNLKDLTIECRRIADALEAYLSVAHNYHMRAPLPSDPTAEDASVAYADDETSAKLEIIDDLVRTGLYRKPKFTPEEEEDT
jgi:hypothetical protein